MMPLSRTLDSDETHAVLSAALRGVQGADARLEEWALVDGFTTKGKGRVVRFDLKARLDGDPHVQRHQWLGKFFGRDEDARKVAAVLQELAASDAARRGGVAVPTVISYYAPRRLLLMTYEPGEPVGSVISSDTSAVLTALGRALATLHAIPIPPPSIVTPAILLDDVRLRVEELRGQFPDEAPSLRGALAQLEREAPSLPADLSFVHGDFGPANLLWRLGQIVVLDFDKCARGDPALDLGNLLVQVRRIPVRKPDTPWDFASARTSILDAYRRWSPPDPELDRRVRWYEGAILLRKIHRLVFTQRGEEREARRAEGEQLLRLLSTPQDQPTRVRPPAAGLSFGTETESASAGSRPGLAALRQEGYPVDPDFPGLPIASDPRLMLDVFRAHLKPVAGRVYHIEDCVPVWFRCRQSGARCVLQYKLRMAEPSTGRRWDQWVTGVLFAHEGKAENRWRRLQAANPTQGIPESWLTFEPVTFIPELQMLVQVFPFDRRLQNLSAVLGGALRGLEPSLLARLGSGEWLVEERTIELTRYRTEIGAALRYTIGARDAGSAKRETVRCYVKVHREEKDVEAMKLLRSLSDRAGDAQRPYSVVKPIAHLSDVRCLAVEEAPGVSLIALLRQGDDPADVMHRVARAVAAFNQDDLPIARKESLADQLDVVQSASTLVQWACPEARQTAQAVTAEVVQGLEEVPRGPIHGDLKPDHIFLSGDRVAFIDLDRAALADPVRDPAHLLSYIVGRVGLDPTPPAQTRAAAAAFVEEYFHHVPEPWRLRFPLHCAGALIEVAAGLFRHQEPGWREKMARAIEAAQNALSNRLW
jgi:Ser/Thr protein kinase RdoA (MazF antagonist)